MSDYKELVEELRSKHIEDRYKRLTLDAADAIERITAMYEKAEMDATNLTGKLAQAEADVERLNREVDERICTEIELSNMVDALGQKSVDIVRCGECKYTDDDGFGAIYCQMWDGWEMPEDAYCYLGERKDKA